MTFVVNNHKAFLSQALQWKLVVLFIVLSGFCAVTTQAQGTNAFDISPQPLNSALRDFARQSGLQLAYTSEQMAGYQSPGVAGEFTATEALRRLLGNSGVQFSFSSPTTIVFSTPSTASSADDGAIRLAAVRVHGSYIPEADRDWIYDTAGSVSVVTQEDMERTGPRHASEILQATPGVFTVTNEQNPSVSVNIRGLKDFGRVNMNIDGMRQNYQRSGHGQRNGEMFFDAEFLREVEITKGSSTGAGGAGVTGGIATFRTLEAEDILTDSKDTFAGRLRLTHGVPSLDNGQELSGSLALAFRPTENTDLLLAYSQKGSSAYEPGKKGDAFYWDSTRNYYDQVYGSWSLPVSVVNGTGQDTEAFLAKGNWFIGADSIVKFTLLYSKMEYGESQSINEDDAARLSEYNRVCLLDEYINTPFCQTFVYDPANAHPIANVNATANYSVAVDYFYNPDTNWIDFNSKFYVVSTDNDSERLGSDYQLNTSTDTIGLLLENTSRFFTTNTLTELNYGVESFRDQNQPDANSTDMTGVQLQLASGATPKGKRQITSVWLKADWTLKERLTISPGLSWEQYHLWGVTGFTAYDMRQNPNGTPVSTYGDRLWQFAELDVDHTGSKFLPTLGAAYKLFDEQHTSLQLFANAGLGWRPPAITETLTAGAIPYHQPPVNTFPNWYLEPETTRSWEVGLNYRYSNLLQQQDSFALKLTHFSNTTEDYIRYVQGIALPGMTRQSMSSAAYDNALNELNYYGQELDVSYTSPNFYTSLLITHTQRNVGETGYPIENPSEHLISHAWPLGNLDANNNYLSSGWCSPVRANNDRQQYCLTSGDLYDPLVPEWSGRFALGFWLFEKKLNLGSNVTCSSRTGWHAGGGNLQASLNGQEGQRSFCVQDLYGSYQFNQHLSIGYNLKNLWDREYAQAMGDAMVKSYAPGRTLTAFVDVRF
jgi:heme acquisition protein HasR